MPTPRIAEISQAARVLGNHSAKKTRENIGQFARSKQMSELAQRFWSSMSEEQRKDWLAWRTTRIVEGQKRKSQGINQPRARTKSQDKSIS